MNRIYHGRVTKIEIFNGKNAEPQPLENWDEKLLVSPKVADRRRMAASRTVSRCGEF